MVASVVVVGLVVLLVMRFEDVTDWVGRARATMAADPPVSGDPFPVDEPGALRQSGSPIALAGPTDRPGAVYASTGAMVYNSGAVPVRITAWEPINARHLTVVGVKLLGNAGGFTGREGFPPIESGTTPALLDVGAPMAPLGHVYDASESLPRDGPRWLVVGYELDGDGATIGSFDGLRLTVDAGGGREEILDVRYRQTLCLTPRVNGTWAPRPC